MNNRNLKAHRGLTNEILFTVKDRDRKLQNMFAYELYANLIDPSTKKRILSRQLDHTLDLGKAKLTLTEADLANITPGRYHIYISRKDDNVNSLALYKDQDNNVRFDIEITDQVGLEPIETQTVLVSDIVITSQGLELVGVTPAMTGNLCRNFINAQHTIHISLLGYAGIINVQASGLESVPDQDHNSTDWYTVSTIDLTDTATTGDVVRTFQANCNWVRVVFIVDQDDISGPGISAVKLRN